MNDTPDTSDSAHAPVNLLWTGGWDSTFRLLDLVLIQGRPVRPYYAIHAIRPGTLHEVRAMERILEGVEARAPDARARIARTRTVLEHDLPHVAPAYDAFERLVETQRIGRQYPKLASFAEMEGLTDLELSVHLDDSAEPHLRPHVEPNDEGYGLSASASDDVQALFGRFRFPLLDLTKPDMLATAQAHGFEDLMGLTWFCHNPEGDEPCGMCNPCQYTMAEGMAWRIPRRRQIAARARPVTDPLKRVYRGIRRRLPI